MYDKTTWNTFKYGYRLLFMWFYILSMDKKVGCKDVTGIYHSNQKVIGPDYNNNLHYFIFSLEKAHDLFFV